MRIGVHKLTKRQEAELLRSLQGQRVGDVRRFLNKSWNPALLIDGENPLNECDSPKVARLLLAAGADVNAGRHNWTPLLFNCDRGREDLVALFLEAGANVNLAYSKRGCPQIAHGTTPLMTASGHGYLPIVKRLLRAGADVNAVDGHGHNALFRAAYWDRTSVAKALLLRGSDLTEDILGGAVHHGNLELVRLLIGKGADVNCVLRDFEAGGHFFDGETLLGCAVRKGCLARQTGLFSYPLKIIDALLQAGADPNLPSQDGARKRDPVSIATSWGQEKVFDMLKKRGARKSLREAFEGGWTLHGACFAGRTAVVKLLLKAGFDPSAPDKTGKTPMEYAAERGHSETIKLLQRAGAGVRGGGMI